MDMTKKSISGFFLALVVLTSLGLVGVSADSETIVAGKIYETDDMTGPVVSGADVTVDCYHDGDSSPNTEETTSADNGAYGVGFDEDECDDEDEVIVTATKDGMSGSKSGNVTGDFIGDLNVAIINVSIPEFSAIAASIALIGSGIGFLVLRKKRQ